MTDFVREVVDWIAAYWRIPVMIGGVIAALAVFLHNILTVQKLRLEVAQLRRAREIKDTRVRLATIEETLKFGNLIEVGLFGGRDATAPPKRHFSVGLAAGLVLLVALSPLVSSFVDNSVLGSLYFLAGVIFVVGIVTLRVWWYVLAERERSRTRSELRRVKNELSTSAASSGDEQAGV